MLSKNWWLKTVENLQEVSEPFSAQKKKGKGKERKEKKKKRKKELKNWFKPHILNIWASGNDNDIVGWKDDLSFCSKHNTYF